MVSAVNHNSYEHLFLQGFGGLGAKTSTATTFFLPKMIREWLSTVANGGKSWLLVYQVCEPITTTPAPTFLLVSLYNACRLSFNFFVFPWFHLLILTFLLSGVTFLSYLSVLQYSSAWKLRNKENLCRILIFVERILLLINITLF